MSMSETKIKTMWRRACVLAHEGEYLKAKLAEALVAEHGKLAWRALAEACGLRSNTAQAVIRLSKLLAVCPDRDTWIAVGAYGVRKLADMSPRKRVNAAKCAVAEWRKVGASLGPKAAAKALGALPAKAKAPRTGASRVAPSVERDLLAAAIRRIVAGPCPFVADLLTDAERKAAGIKAPRKRSKAS